MKLLRLRKRMNDLIQNKRKKMLFLILLLMLIPFNQAGINLTYIVKRDGNNITPSCIAEEFERYEAVGWVYPIPSDEEGIPNITTKFIPTIISDYSCKFSKNNICTKRWELIDWSIDDSSARTKDFIADYRWEDLRTVLVSNKTKEFEERTEVNPVFKSGISVRAAGVIELLICSGWNPYNHPCYHFNIDSREVYLNKYAVLPQDLNDTKSAFLEYYKANSNIVSHDEWRNFIISFDENRILKLFDVNLNRIVVQHVDDGTFNPMYLLVRSEEPSLWKFHHDEFFYTKTAQTSRLGPQLTLFNRNLCISLLVSLCETCEFIFFYKNGSTKRILKQVRHLQNSQWMEIKLKEENVQLEKLNIFVETNFVDQSVNQTGFWAIDNVRICNENEVKVTYLKLNEKVDEDGVDISCQLVKNPGWRPKRLEYNKIKGFPQINAVSNETSIKLSWEQEDTRNEINYFVLYQANDICVSDPHNVERVKSSGFLTTKYNEIVIDNLVPYTLYNITISTVLHESDKRIQVPTLETVEPTFQELPLVQLRHSDSAVIVSWQQVPCTAVYGKLIYTLTVSNEKLNFVKRLSLKTDISYKIDGLQPYVPYTLNVTTARNAASIYRGVHSRTTILNFTTLPGVAEAVENLELYSIDENSVSLRYDLPKNLNGVPTDIQVNRCYALSFSKCKPSVSKVKPCPLWPRKLCVVVNNLIPRQYYTFKVSLKNLYTFAFGKEANVSGFTADRVPGAPTNVTYKTVDCDNSTDFCHLNVTWWHPYYENGTITAFNIMLNSTDKFKTNDNEKYIHEVYAVPNKTYSPNYTYQIKVVPYSAQYILSLQSVNTLYKSNFTRIMVNTDNLDDHINQSPELLNKTDSSLVFKISQLDPRLEYYILKVIVQDFDVKTKFKPGSLEDRSVFDKLCHNFGNTWIYRTLKITNNDTETITIGSSEKGKIQPKTQYCVTFIITNRYKGADHDVVYYKKLETPDAPEPIKEASTSSSSSHLYVLLLLLLLIPIGFFIYRCLRKRRVIKKQEEEPDNVYETLPFDECENNFVNNDNYDHLLHN